MTSPAPYLLGAGLTCALGSHAATSVAAIVAGLGRLGPLSDPPLVGEPTIIARVEGNVPLATDPDRRVLGLLLDAVDDLVANALPESMDKISIFVGWPDPQRPGAPSRPTPMLLADVLGPRVRRLLEPDRVLCLAGETSGAQALTLAAWHMANDDELDACLVVAADSWLTAEALRWLAMCCPLRRMVRGEGMVPAEAGAAVWLIRASQASFGAQLLGSGVTQVETASSGGCHLGLAMEHALSDAAVPLHTIDHTVLDAGSDSWGSTEFEVAMARLARRPWQGNAWNVSESIGNVGAPAGIIAALVAADLLGRHGDGGTALCVVSGHRCRITEHQVARVN